MKIKKILTGLAVAAMATPLLVGCASDADVASENLSEAADNFEVLRRVVFVNGITDEYLLEILGYCSIDDDGGQLEVTCKVEGGGYKKHFLGLSDNVTYFVEQVEAADVSTDYYRVTFKPQSIIPDIDVDPVSELPDNQPN